MITGLNSLAQRARILACKRVINQSRYVQYLDTLIKVTMVHIRHARIIFKRPKTEKKYCLLLFV